MCDTYPQRLEERRLLIISSYEGRPSAFATSDKQYTLNNKWTFPISLNPKGPDSWIDWMLMKSGANKEVGEKETFDMTATPPNIDGTEKDTSGMDNTNIALNVTYEDLVAVGANSELKTPIGTRHISITGSCTIGSYK